MRMDGRSAVARFWRREDGALIPFAIQLFVVMMVTLGITVDLMRQEELRSKIQNTLDRATLAAASLSQDLDPATVVMDYLDKAGLGYLDVQPVIEEGALKEWRRVTVSATDGVTTLFGPLIGIESLATNASARAEESIGNVEISLVLDISGSMDFNINTGKATGSPTRMEQLKPAALNFVQKMFDTVQAPGAPEGRLSISIVPYNQQVTLGADLGAAFTLSSDHSRNTCADVTVLPSSAIAIAPATTLTRTMYGDSFDYWGQPELGQGSWSLQTTAYNQNCQEASHAAVLAWGSDQTVIETKINALTPGGDTAIDVGARWGLALLDPAAQPALETLIANGKAASSISGRPMAYGNGSGDLSKSAMKILVLMTDGENTRSYSTKPAYRTGTSGFVSTQSASAFSTARSDWNALYYYVEGRSAPYYRLSDGTWRTASQVGASRYDIAWETIWNKGYTLQYLIEKFLLAPKRAVNGSVTKTALYADMAIQSEFSDKDAALQAVCSVAKAPERSIYIFTVAVNAPTAGAEILRKCASDDGYAYNVNAASLTEAFSSIASAINALRLTN